MKCNPGGWILIQCELELCKIMNIVHTAGSLSRCCLVPGYLPSRTRSLLIGGDRDELGAGEADGRHLLYEGWSRIPNPSALGWGEGTRFGAE